MLSLLSDWLRHVEMRIQVFARPELCGGWRINTGLSERCTFHVLMHGRAWLHRRGQPECELSAGQLVFASPGQWHCLTATGGAAGDDCELDPVRVAGDNARSAGLVCGWIDVPDPGLAPLLAALPDVLVLGASTDASTLNWLGGLTTALASGCDDADDVLLRHLGELVLLLVSRHALSGEGASGLLAAVRDRRLGAVLASVQRDPAQPWTLESMARLAHMSRTAFALHFHSTVGETPAAFVRRWRMLQARNLMRQGRLSVSQIAEACGYRSESAFRRAYGRGEKRAAS
jgi:AraC-like DNA-binding protein